MMTHRRPREHLRRVRTKMGRKTVLVNKGIVGYRKFVSRRMKAPEIKKLSPQKRLGAVAKEWNKMKTGRSHMKGARVLERYPGEFRTFRPRPTGTTSDVEREQKKRNALQILKASGALSPDGSLDLDKFFALKNQWRLQVINSGILPTKAKEQLKYARPVIEGSG